MLVHCRIARSLPAIVFALLVAACATAPTAPLGRLGTVDFPTSGDPAAQQHFVRGVAALHSFWYPVALEEFRAASRTDPDFVMALWGEAMAHNHPLWGDPQETRAAREVIARIDRLLPGAPLTERERGYVEAIRVLYGEGEKHQRDRDYAAAMGALAARYPQDREAAAFHALALLGSVPAHEASGARTRMRAGAIAMRIFGEQPDHPGAAHYILHAFDDPDHAILALPAARAYASIAPAAPHALHMPSHIFLQLGMWPEAAASNEASWRASREWVERRALPASELDFHSLHWLLYVYLQQGRYAQAEALLRDMRDRLAAFPAGDARARVYATFTAASMAAAYIVETRQWHRAEELLGPPDRSAIDAKQVPEALRAYVAVAQIPAIFARGLAAATLGSPQAGDSVAALRAIGKAKPRKPVPFVSELLAATEIQALEIQAASRAAAGDLEEALRIAERASALADRTPPPPGPPMVIKPAHELYGELLLAARRDGEAASHFDTAARRHPGRALSILGFARAAERSGDGQAAASAYAQLLQQWQHADATLPASQEARDYLARTRLSSGPRE